ncbi:semaphorin-4B-like [Hippocampus zosterae]|uniref:semaphorin-4B-like n=1 Tax=Hippocampus zosterae TaxID=109293 RepID=UPI00223E5F5B|nr:semaphorin-4B-like [Hippocampus zosterae]
MGRLAAPLCALLLVVTLRRVAGRRDVTPRLAFSYDAEERRCPRFSGGGLFNVTSLLLSKEDGALYVGAREALFALDPADIGARERRRKLPWKTPDEKRRECSFKGKDLQTDCFNYIKILLRLNGTRLYVCGTYAFSPVCAYVDTASFTFVASGSGEALAEDGRGRCPFDPEFRSTAVMADGELFAAAVGDFQGNEPAISKSLGRGAALKTESSLNWLEDPAFVGSAYIPESLPRDDPAGDDDKIYFFFSEAATELDLFDNAVVSRIARVCRGDAGGERVLQKKWTTFLKAQLSCSLPGDGFPFNVIQDMFVLTPGPHAWKETVFYGVFASQWSNGGAGTSAVCSFTMEQVRKAFDGRYRRLNRETRQWSTFNGAVPEPRPGSCITNAARKRGVLSSLHVPDKALNFVKDHFLMDEVLRGQPLLLNRRARYTRIAVHHVAAAVAPRRAYRVLFVGTDDGRLHKAVSVKKKMHVIEELLLFRHSRPVRHLQLDAEKGLLHVSTFSELVSVPLANCSNYAGCGDCILSRDPYCAWNGRRCVEVARAPPNRFLRQDVDNGDARAVCDRTAAGGRFAESARARARPCQSIVIPADTFRVLPCRPRSKLARRLWRSSDASGRSHYPGAEGGLAVVARAGGRETYECWSLEGGFRQLLANYCVRGRELGSPRLAADTYWSQLVAACALLAFSPLLFALFVIYGHRRRTKGSGGPAAPPERPPSAAEPPGNLPAERGGPRRPSPDGGESFSESVSAAAPRPRVRLAPEIRDSLV